MIKRLLHRTEIIVTGILTLALGAGVAFGLHYSADRLPIQRYFSTDYTNAIWDWSNVTNHTPQSLRQLASFLYMHQLNAVYVDVGIYESIMQNPNERQRADDRRKLEEAIERYVSALQRYDIEVYAAAGDVYWSDPDKQQVPLGILAFAQEYNGRYPEASLAGVQFDIESYNQDGFPEGSNTVKTLVLLDWLHMVDVLVETNLKHIEETQKPFELGFAIPYWFDNQNGNIPEVTWKNKTGPTLFHLLDRLNDLPKSNVVVMAYRNAARGNDGVIAHSRTEIDYAHARAQRVSVIIGQEVTDVEPAKITYYGETRVDVSAQFGFVKDAFGASDVLGGIAINDLAGYQEMAAGN